MSEFYEAISNDIKQGEFSVCEKVGEDYLCKYSGKLSDIADSLVSVGIIRNILLKGQDVYFIVNAKDLPEAELDDDYDISG